MGGIDETDDERTEQTATEPEPQGCQDDRQSPVTVVKIGEMKRGQVMEKADADDEEQQDERADDR